MTPTPLSDLDRSWVVEASAGTGKTTALVDRIVEVIAAGTPVETIVAVTFTHAAAGNMKLRVRHELNAAPNSIPMPAGACRSGAQPDRAFIGTIHAFSTQLYAAGVEARIDPVFQELAQPDALQARRRLSPLIESRLPRPLLPVPCPRASRLACRAG
jgi:ATP-dependent exoDNAse (exonuclease V) beta subunit